MTQLRLRTVDAFTDQPFAGNPAAVVVLDEAPPDDWMAAVARETKQSDTGFVVRQASTDADFALRWFTQGAVEVDLCGHATLAAAHCLFEDGIGEPVRFATRSGVLTVSKRPNGSLAMDFPARPPQPIDTPSELEDALGAAVQWSGCSDNSFLIAVLADERTIRELTPDIGSVAKIPADAVIVTATADTARAYDFVSACSLRTSGSTRTLLPVAPTRR